MKKLTTLTILIFLFTIHGARGDDVTSGVSASSYMVTSSGGNNAAGDGVQADLFSGAATYNIDLPLPPGVNGFKPNLTLSYNSNRKNPNSWVGYGWELNMGYIERVADSSGIIDYDDGTNYEIHFGTKSESLVRAESNINPSPYGLSYGSEYVVDRYEPLVEGAYSVYLHLRYTDTSSDIYGYHDAGWIIIDKSGMTYTYGTVEDSQISQTTAYDDTRDEIIVDHWYLDSIQDQNGNVVSVTYAGFGLIHQISYEDITVDFDLLHASKDNYYPVYKQYLQSSLAAVVLLTNITISSNSTRLQKIALNYSDDAYSKFKYLDTITQYGATDSEFMEPTILDYYQLDPSSFAWDTTGQDYLLYHPSTVRPDGRGIGGAINDYVILTDMNGDGLVDEVASYQNSDKIYVYYNNGNDFEDRGTDSEWTDPLYGDICSLNSDYCGKLTAKNGNDYQIVYLLDLNGDRLPDRFYARSSSNGITDMWDFVVAFNTGNGFSSATEVWRDRIVAGMWGNKIYKVGFVDMNGDGLVDRVEGTDVENKFRVYYNSGKGFSSSPVYWDDPFLGYGDDDSRVADIIDYDSDGNIRMEIRDINNDGQPDRTWAGQCYEGPADSRTLIGGCFTFQINKNGQQFNYPDFTSSSHGTLSIIDGVTSQSIIDPIADTDSAGMTNMTNGWMDINGDGFVDRIEGLPDDNKFTIHFYQGIQYGSDYSYLDSSIDLSGTGYFIYGNFSNDNKYYWNFLMDINGDGYPDKVAYDASPSVYKVYPLRANAIEFSDSPSTWTDQKINQPMGALKSVDDGHGGKMIIEYLPSTKNPRSPVPYQRFMPMNVYTVHKIYVKDPTLTGTDGTKESERYPGYRYSTYDFSGGNYYVRYAQKASSDPDDETITTKYYATFNGFQKIEITSNPGAGETWVSTVETDIFQQAKGDISLVDASEEIYFEAGAYGDLSISGRLYKNEKSSNGTTLYSVTNTWEATNLDSDLGINLVTLASKTESVTEPGETTSRTHRTDYNYDDYANLTSIINYDGAGTLLSETDMTYYSTSDFDATLQIKNRLRTKSVKSATATFRNADFSYDTHGNITTENYYSDASHYLSLQKTYTSSGQLQTLTGTDGVTHTTTYDGDNIFVATDSIVLPSGDSLVTSYEHDRMSGSVTKQTAQSGVQVRTDYDNFSRPTSQYVFSTTGTENLNKSARYTYGTYTVDAWSDVTLLKTEVWQPQDGYSDTETSGNPARVTFTNHFGQVLQSCEYSERGNYRMTQSRMSNGGRTVIQTEPVFVSSCGFVSSIASTATTTTQSNDAFGRPVAIDLPTGDSNSPIDDFTVSYTTNTDGHLVRTLSSTSGKSIIEEYDTQNRLYKKTDPAGNVLQYTYDTVGNLLQVNQGISQLLVVSYDWLGRKLTSSDPDMGAWSYQYNNSGLLYRQTDNKSQVVQLDYDSVSRISQKTIYNSAGDTEKTVTYSYDSGDTDHDVSLGELFQVSEFDSTGTELRNTKQGYDANYRTLAKISRSLDSNVFTQTVSSDFRGQQQSITYPGGTSLIYQYNRVGGLNSLCSDTSCDSTANALYYAVNDSSAFDAYGNLLSESYGNGVTSNYSYYANSHRLQTLSIARGTDAYSTRSFNYDADANITAINDSLGQTSASAYSNVDYDELDRMTSYTPTSTSTAVSFSYDNNGNVLTNAANHGTDIYQYDANDKPHAVKQIGAESFTYDNNGNMLTDASRTMSYDSENHLTGVTLASGVSSQYAYDFSGNRTTQTVTRTNPDLTTTTNTTTYLGDAIEIRDGLVVLNIFAGSKKIATRTLGTISELLGSGSASLKGINIDSGINLTTMMPYLLLLAALLILVTFRPVNPLNIRQPALARFVKSWQSIIDPVRVALAELQDRPMLRVTSLALITLIIWQTPIQVMADSSDSSSSSSAATNFFYFHHGDSLGSTHVITEGDVSHEHSGITYLKGDLVQRFEYDPFGHESYVLNPGLDLEVSYTGQKYDDATGLYYYKSRYYNPVLARFIQPDTIIPDAGDFQSYNRYSYVVNNPLKYTDPSGHSFSGEDMGGYGVPSVDIPDGGMPVGASGSVISGITSGSMVTTVIFGSMTMPSMEGGDISADESDDMLISVDLRNIVSVTYDANSNGIPEMDIGIGDYSENILNGTQFGLSVVTIGGLFFGPPGLVFSSVAGAANGLISMARGNYVSGGIGVALSVFPLIGMLGKVGMVVEGETQIVLKEGQYVNRVWDSRWTPGSNYSGPTGGSYTPGNFLPINTNVATVDRGLEGINGLVNNAGKGGVFKAVQDIPATLRQSIGGTAPEIVIRGQYRDYLEPVYDSFSNIPIGR